VQQQKKLQSNNNYKPKTTKMKKTDFFKLALMCAVVLLIGAYSNSFAQANKAGSVDGKGSNANPSAVDPGSAVKNSNANDAAKSAEEQKMQRNCNCKMILLTKKLSPIRQQDARVKAKMAKANKAETNSQAKGAYAPAPVNGLSSLNAADQNATASNNTAKPSVQQINNDFKAGVSKIAASAASYDAAKREIFQLQSKTMKAVKIDETDALWQEINDAVNNTMEVELNKINQKFSSNAKN
jgi:hypothetical protein